ncbi:MAG: hypothetical protein KC457_05615 [Myxococcales bacterium]|nr:hypothetical protein [Myxococcales bacterium]
MHKWPSILVLVVISLGCREAGPTALEAREIGVIEQDGAIEGRDGGTSALVWGRSIWTYGDTVLTLSDEPAPAPAQPQNEEAKTP